MSLKLSIQLAALLGLALGASIASAKPVLEDSPIVGVYRELGYLPLADGTTLAYVVYRPPGTKRRPTIAWFDAYGAGSMFPTDMVMAWLKRGYAFVGASARGTGCSQGQYEAFSPQEAQDGAAVVEWAAAQAWSNGKVGLSGNSQPGIVQFAIAALQPPHLVAIAAGGTVAHSYGDFWYPGGIFNFGFAKTWSESAQPDQSQLGSKIRVMLGDTACVATAAARSGPNRWLQHLLAQPRDGDLYRASSPFELARSIRVPTLMVQSWTDPAIGSSAVWVFDRIASPRKRLLLLNGGHEAYLYTSAFSEVQRWMDHWLKGEDNGIAAAARARIDFETRVTGKPADQLTPTQASWSVELADWPAPQTQWRTLQLSADGRLDDVATTAAALPGKRGKRSYAYRPDVPAFAARADSALRYRSAPMTTDTAIIGSPQLRLFASSSNSDTDFMVMLRDVAANGETTDLQRGLLRASRRAVDEARSSPQQVVHPQQRDEPLKPGATYEFRLSIWPMAHVLRAGHVLELVIAAPGSTAAWWWNLQALPQAGFNVVQQSLAHPSQLSLPVVPGLLARSKPPKCSSLPYQPCTRNPAPVAP